MQLNSWWSITGGDKSTIDAANTALVGARVEDKLARGEALSIKLGNAKLGDAKLGNPKLGNNDRSIGPHLVFRSGSDDDSRIYIDLPTFIAWTGVQPNTALLRVNGKPREIQSMIDRLSAALPQGKSNLSARSRRRKHR